MADRRVRDFVERYVDSLVKLQILMLFAERTVSKSSVREMVQRTARDIWSVTEALEELVAAGIVDRRIVDGELIYTYNPSLEQRELIDMMARAYNDPLTRNELHSFVRSLPTVGSTSLYRSYGEPMWGVA